MSIKLAVLMDPIENIDPHHDSTFSMLLAAQKKDWEIYYFQQQDIFSDTGAIKAVVQRLSVKDATDYYQLSDVETRTLSDFDLVLMRKDPPFDMEYIYITYLLEQAQQQGTWVVNNPQSLRDANEKLFTLWFPEYCPKTLVSSNKEIIKQFWHDQGECILKPLDGMGGKSIFHVKKDDININVIIEMLTDNGHVHIMAQEYLPQIMIEGDKRIIMINGEPVKYALARFPSEGDFRGNMAAGATVKAIALSEQELALCDEIGPVLREKGLFLVGLDVIGGYITEINVTSPTGIQELNRLANLDIAADFLNQLERNEKLRGDC